MNKQTLSRKFLTSAQALLRFRSTAAALLLVSAGSATAQNQRLINPSLATSNWVANVWGPNGGPYTSAWVNGDIAAIGLGGTAQTVTVNSPVSASVVYLFTNGTTINGSSALTILSGGSLYLQNSHTVTVACPIAGTNGLDVLTGAAGTGVFTLSGLNTYTGATFLRQTGQVFLGRSTSGSNGALGAISNGLTLVDTVTLDLKGFDVGVGELAGTGTITNSSATLGTITVGNGSVTSIGFTGVITGNLGLTMAPSSILKLPGANTYTGATTVGSGTLIVTGSLASTNVATVSGGASLRGTGSVGVVTVNSTGFLNPGENTTPGTLSTRNLTVNSGGTYIARINSATAGTGYSRINTTGSVTLGGTLSLSGSYVPTSGNTFTILENDGSDAISGTFTGLAQGATVTFNGVALTISYTGGTGNDVVLTAPAAPPNYTINTSGGVLTFTDTSGLSETLNFASNGAGQVRFIGFLTTSTFSINGAANTTGNSANIALAGLTRIVINAGEGTNVVNITATSEPLPSLEVNGGSGDDRVNFDGVTFVNGANLTVNLNDDAANPGADIIGLGTNDVMTLSGAGAVHFECSRSIELSAGSGITTASGNITLRANQQTTAAIGVFTGVDVAGSVTSTTGDVLIEGRSGDAVNGGTGVRISAGSVRGRNVTLTGRSNYAGGTNYGVLLGSSTGNTVAASGGNVTINGTASQTAGSANLGYGVFINDATISTTGTGSITATGTGANSSVAGANRGIVLGSGTISVTAETGSITLNGIPGPNSSVGLALKPSVGAGTVTVSTGGGPINLNADTLSIAITGVSVDTGATGTVTLAPLTAGTTVNVGSPMTGTFDPLESELDAITTGNLIIGSAAAGNLTVAAAMTRAAATNVTLRSGGSITQNQTIDTGGGTLLLDCGNSPASIKPKASGTDVTASTLSFGSDVTFNIAGTTAQTQYDQLVVVGAVDVTGDTLVLTGVYVPVIGNTFTLIDNDGTDAIVGTFTGLAQGAALTFNGVPMRISYTGGTGNDVVLSLANSSPTDIALGNSSVAENAGANATVGTLSSTDADVGDSHTYSFVAGTGDTDNASFNINGSALRLTASANFETKSSYSVRIQTTDGTATFAKAFTISITNVNEMPSFTGGAHQTLPNGTSTGQTVTGWATNINDGDSTVTQTLTFNVSNNNNALFSTQPAIASDGTLTYTPNGTAGTVTVSVSLTDDNSINGTPALTTNSLNLIITVQSPANYGITTAAGVMTITDNSGNGDTLALSEPSAGNILFTATGRTFSLNGAANTTSNSGTISLSGITSVVINAAVGADTISIEAFTTVGGFPALTVDGGRGDDRVSFLGDITFASNADLNVDLQNDDASPGTDRITFSSDADLSLSGTGSATLRVSRDVAVGADASLVTVNGALTVEANQQATTTAQAFPGVSMGTGTSFSATGTGIVTVRGKGGTTLGSTECSGITLEGTISGGSSGTLTVQGTGGSTTGAGTAHGISASFGNITSIGAAVNVTGAGGTSSHSSSGHGLNLVVSTITSATTTAAVTVVGTGGTSIASFGVSLNTGSNITSSGGNVSVTGTGNTGSFSSAVGVSLSASTITSGSSGTVRVEGTGGGSAGGSGNQGVQLGGTGVITSGGSGTVQIIGRAGLNASNGIFLVAASSAIRSGGGNVSLMAVTTDTSQTGLLLTNGIITTATNGGHITIAADRMTLTAGSISADNGSGVLLAPYTAGRLVDLGAADSATVLGLTDAELDLVSAGILQIGNSTSGTMTLSAAITRPAPSAVNLHSAADIIFTTGSMDAGSGSNIVADVSAGSGAVKPNFAGTDAAGTSFGIGGKVEFNISGTTVDTQYQQLKVNGFVYPGGSQLVLSGSYVPAAGETFVIVDNDNTEFIGGFFGGLFQDSIITFNGVPLRISYTGGTGNDITLTALLSDINVQGNSLSIASGDIFPSSPDHTQFLSVAAATGTSSRTFTIQNTGNAVLTLAAGSITLTGANAADFTVSGITLPASINPAASTTFTVTFDPSAVATRNATVNIASNDPDENPYTFAIQGSGLNSIPTDIALTNSSVPENAGANATIGTLSTTDADAGDTHSYSLVTGTGDTDNASFNLSGNTLRLTASADFETKSSYSVRVQTSDGTATYAEAFTIAVTNVNEAPTITGQSALVATIGQPFTLTLSQLTVADVDSVFPGSFTLTAADGAGYTRVGNTITPSAGTGTITVPTKVNDGELDSPTFNVVITLNHVPVANPDAMGARSDTPAPVIARKFALNDTDADGNVLTIISVSPTSAHGTVSLSAGNILYSPTAGYIGSDSFTYTVSDPHGATATGTVNVTVTDKNAASQNSSIKQTANGFEMTFAGIPGTNYIIQHSPDLINWQTLTGPVSAAANGLIEYVDNPQPAPPSRFYRTIVAP